MAPFELERRRPSSRPRPGNPAKAPTAPGEGVAENDPRFATASAAVEEPAPDAQKQGVTPSYAEVLAASIEGLGENFEMTLRFADDIPEEMPDENTFMVIGFGLKHPKDDDKSWAFGAQGTHKGWTPYAGGQNSSFKEGNGKFPGEFVIDGNEIRMVVPWSYIRGPRDFDWQTQSGWFKRLANTSHYAFDLVPNKEQAHYPG